MRRVFNYQKSKSSIVHCHFLLFDRLIIHGVALNCDDRSTYRGSRYMCQVRRRLSHCLMSSWYPFRAPSWHRTCSQYLISPELHAGGGDFPRKCDAISPLSGFEVDSGVRPLRQKHPNINENELNSNNCKVVTSNLSVHT